MDAVQEDEYRRGNQGHCRHDRLRLPLSFVEGDGFRRLMGIVAPDYDVPCCNTIRSRIMQRYDREREALSTEMESVSSTAITTDTWTFNSKQSFITVTEHHIADNRSIKTNVLMTRVMPERHTGENLANRLKDCVQEFNIEGKVETVMCPRQCKKHGGRRKYV